MKQNKMQNDILNEVLERNRLKYERLKKEFDWFSNMPWWRRLLLRIIKSSARKGYTLSGEDTHCFIECRCDEQFSASDAWITWCPKCGMGYSTEFRVYFYPPYRLIRRKSDETKQDTQTQP